MSVQLESVKRINALKNGIEAVTGESYEDLTAGVQALKNGYGQGGGTGESKPEQQKTVDIIENGTTEILPDNGKVLSKVTVNVNIEGLDMSEAVNAQSMFYDTGITTFPLKNTGKIQSFRLAFYNCNFTEAELDLTSCADMRDSFNRCLNLKKLRLYNSKITSSYWEKAVFDCSALEDFYIDSFTVTGDSADFSTCKNLSVESLVNLLNALSDNTDVSKTYTVKLGATNLAKLTAEQKQIATNKKIALA